MCDTDGEMVIFEGKDEYGNDCLIQKWWGEMDWGGGNYCCVEFSWDDGYENQNGDMDTLLRELFVKANERQKMMLRIIINELRRHIIKYPEFGYDNYFYTKQKSDNHVMFFLTSKTETKQIYWNKIKSNGIDLKKILWNFSREDRRGYDKILKRHIDC
jgi:hypothetical protein